MTRRKFTGKFKTKVVLEALKERSSLAELAQKYEVHPNQISKWKKEFMAGAEEVFSKGKRSQKTEAEEEKDRLLKVIGQQKVELDSCLPAGRF
jgi:transposase